MKKQILEGLRAKFPGVSDSILSRIAERLAKTVTTEEGVTAAIEEVTTQSLLESYGDSRATEATQSAVSNYEKRHGLKDGQKAENPAGTSAPAAAPATATPPAQATPPADDDTPAWAKTIIEGNNSVLKRLSALEGDKIVTTRKQQLTDVLAKAPAKFKERIEKDFDRLTFTDDEDFASWLGDIQTDAEAAIAEDAAKGAVFGVPGASNKPAKGKEATDADIDALVASM